MTPHKEPRPKPPAPLYAMTGITLLALSGEGSESLFHASGDYVLAVCVCGSCCISPEEDSMLLQPGELRLLPPRPLWRIRCRKQQESTCYIITFRDANEPKENRKETLPSLGWVSFRPFARLVELAELWHRRWGRTEDVLEKMEDQVQFQHLLLQLFRQNQAEDGSIQAIKAVERTIELLQESAYENGQVEALAQMANMSVRHYSRLFARLTGESPGKYISRRRIRQSISKLCTTGDSLNAIGREAGYDEPNHYSRSFKKAIGVPPSVFLRQWRSEAKIVALQSEGDLLALGVRPVGGICRYTSEPFRRELAAVRKIPYIPGATGSVFTLRPDLIIAGDYLEGEYFDALRQIAPVARLPWTGVEAHYHLKAIAGILGRESQEQAWFSSYEAKAEDLRRRVRGLGLDQQTASIFYMWGTNIRVFAPRIFPVFYKVLELQPAHGIRHWSPEEEAYGSKNLTMEQFNVYAADHMFMIIQDQTAMRLFAGLKQLYGRVLPAFREKRVHILGPDWYSIDATSLLWQMDRAEALFGR